MDAPPQRWPAQRCGAFGFGRRALLRDHRRIVLLFLGSSFNDGTTQTARDLPREGSRFGLCCACPREFRRFDSIRFDSILWRSAALTYPFEPSCESQYSAMSRISRSESAKGQNPTKSKARPHLTENHCRSAPRSMRANPGMAGHARLSSHLRGARWPKAKTGANTRTLCRRIRAERVWLVRAPACAPDVMERTREAIALQRTPGRSQPRVRQEERRLHVPMHGGGDQQTRMTDN